MPSRDELIEQLKDIINVSDLTDVRSRLNDLIKELESGKLATIDEFFTAVGRGMTNAQRKLDLESYDYITRGRPDFAPETMFRLPKATANLKLQLNSVTEQGIDFLVFERSNTTSQTIEQEISFEIVSVMPPPEAIADLSNLPLGQIVVTNADQRARVKAKLKDVALDLPATDPLQVLASDDGFRRTLLFQSDELDVVIYLPKATGNPERGALGYTSPKEDRQWKQLLNANNDKGPKSAIQARVFAHALVPIADAQEQALIALKRT